MGFAELLGATFSRKTKCTATHREQGGNHIVTVISTRNVVAGAAVLAMASLTACSSKDYDSWSHCMVEESKQGGDSDAVELYCSSRYKLSVEERRLVREQGIRKYNQKHGVSPPAPRVGAIVDGYQFKGGDPANPNNWEVVER